MSNKTRIILGALVLVLACGILYSVITTDTKADCLREWVYCSYLSYHPACDGEGDNAWHKFRCNLCIGYPCPPSEAAAEACGHCQDLGWQCRLVPIDPPNQK